MYGNLNPNTCAWPFSPEFNGEEWEVVNNTDISNPIVVARWRTFDSAVEDAGHRNVKYFQGKL